MRTLLFFAVCLVFVSCNEVDRFLGRNQTKKVTYSYACLDSAVGGSRIGKGLESAGDLIRDVAVSERSITDEVQSQYGQAFHEQAVAEGMFKLNNDPIITERLNAVLQALLAARPAPSGINYFIYPLKDTVVNAFTFGGRIYVSEGMLRKCKGRTDLLYAIIGHEIGHSEMGHIKTTIQELRLSDKLFGEGRGAGFYQLRRLLTASVNQRNELEADYYGIDLTNKLGYDVCTAVSFWKEMSKAENQYSQLEDFFRSHPFSNLRAQCLERHISSNFGTECNINEKGMMPQVR